MLFCHSLVVPQSLDAVQKSFIKHGGKTLHAQVLAVSPESGEVEFRYPGLSRTDKQVYEQVVVCAGPWTNRLFPCREVASKMITGGIKGSTVLVYSSSHSYSCVSFRLLKFLVRGNALLSL